MLTFKKWLKLYSVLYEENELSPLQKYDELVDLHRISYNSKFVEENLTESDKEFIVALFENFKYLKQKNNVFYSKIKNGTVEVAYFNKSRWAVCLYNPEGRQVTKPFEMSEGKVNPMIEIIKKGTETGTLKGVLPLAREK